MNVRERLHSALLELSALLGAEVFDVTLIGADGDASDAPPRWVRAVCTGSVEVGSGLRILAVSKTGGGLVDAAVALAAGIRAERALTSLRAPDVADPAPSALPAPSAPEANTARPGPSARPSAPPVPPAVRLDVPPGP